MGLEDYSLAAGSKLMASYEISRFPYTPPTTTTTLPQRITVLQNCESQRCKCKLRWGGGGAAQQLGAPVALAEDLSMLPAPTSGSQSLVTSEVSMWPLTSTGIRPTCAAHTYMQAKYSPPTPTYETFKTFCATIREIVFQKQCHNPGSLSPFFPTEANCFFHYRK